MMTKKAFLPLLLTGVLLTGCTDIRNRRSPDLLAVDAGSRTKFTAHISQDGELISPGRFIPLLEKTGYVFAVDTYVWEEVYFGDFVLCQLLSVGVHVATAEDTAEDFGVKRFDTASEDGGIAGQGFNGDGFDAEFLDEFLCAAGGINGDALAVEGFDDVFKTVFVVDGDEG